MKWLLFTYYSAEDEDVRVQTITIHTLGNRDLPYSVVSQFIQNVESQNIKAKKVPFKSSNLHPTFYKW